MENRSSQGRASYAGTEYESQPLVNLTLRAANEPSPVLESLQHIRAPTLMGVFDEVTREGEGGSWGGFEKRFDSDRFWQSSLVNFYAVCGEIGSARKVFDEFPEKDVVLWNAMIMGYARDGMVFEEMLGVGEVKPNEWTLLGLISVCTALKDLKMGREIHGSYSLVYGTELVIPVEIGVPSFRTLNFDKENNEAKLRLNLDLLDKKREQAKVRQAALQASSRQVL
ncbi:hypothetical protein Acr_00g0020430 [Actinidia rufa]|uniref:Pentatricopeptide repeat (PPR) superfamily protein n=1 Tax=Actinidia rufa TaxID=165716 RepID=A0A7J0DDR9_9ERIC|nr:hypothetical protein Acr_00g0020430 [Actinidia rufa]